MKVGDKVWLFDINRRMYEKSGKHFTAPIYSEHFYQVIIDGETSRSWLINGLKFPKKNPLGIYTNEQRQDAIWDNVNRQEIIEKVRHCSITELKKIDYILTPTKKG